MPVEVSIQKIQTGRETGYIVRARDIRTQIQHEQLLKNERDKSDKLLKAMLPPAIASQLREGKEVKPQEFTEVTMFFSDVKNFTSMLLDVHHDHY